MMDGVEECVMLQLAGRIGEIVGNSSVTSASTPAENCGVKV